MKRAVPILLWVFLLGFPPESAASGEAVPFKLVRGHLIVAKCSVGGLADLTAIIDTGVSETVLDMSVVRQLSLPTQDDNATFLTQEVKVRAVAIPALQLGPLRAAQLAGIATDLSSLTAEFGFRPQVLIGMDLLRRTNLVIDYEARQIIFGVAGPLAHSARLVEGGPGAHFALVESTVRGKTLRLQVDSGFNGLLVYRNRMGKVAAPAGRDVQVASGAQRLLAHRLDSLDVRIGDWRLRGAQVTVVESAPRDFDGFDGLIGTQVLSKRRVALDFANAKIYWD